MRHLTLRNLNFVLVFVLIALLAQIPAPVSKASGPLYPCSSDVPFLWPNGGANIPYNPDQGDLGPLTNAEAVALVGEAFDVWASVPSATVSYTNAGPLPVDVDFTNFIDYLDPAAPDGQSAIVFDDTGEIFNFLYGPGSGILGFAGPEWVNTASCTVLEGLSFLNGPAFGDLDEAKDVMVHEFGHYNNLAHTVVNGQTFIGLGDTSGPSPHNTFGNAPVTSIETMYPFYFGPSVGTSTLAKDDIISLSRLYPAPGYASSTGTIKGAVLAADGTTRLSGVNVIARNVADPFNDAVSAIAGDFTPGTGQSDAVVGTFTFTGLTPGAEYAIYVDELLEGGFSTTPLSPLPGPEEFYNGANESNSDDPEEFTAVAVTAGNTVSGVNIIFNEPQPGVPLAVGDDGNVQLNMPFAYTICGQSFNSLFVNANGSITFGSPDADFSETAAEFLNDQPRIAPFWDDLNPSAGGTVYFLRSKNDFTVVWNGVPEWSNTGSNTFSVTIRRSSNHIDLQYGDMTAVDGLVGVSCGGAVTSRMEEPVDLSSYGDTRINLQNSPAVYEVFSPTNPLDLANTSVRFNGSTNYKDNWAEPNNTIKKARGISLPFSSASVDRYTAIEPTGNDIDFFSFQLTAGTTLFAEIKAGSLDSLIALFDSQGNLVAVDDDGGSGLLSRFSYPVPASGKYTLAVTTFPDVDFTGAGGSGGRYVLDLSEFNGEFLALGDEDSQEIDLGFSFPFNGNSYTSVFVNSNGMLTFGMGQPNAWNPTVAGLLDGPPRIAPLWDDLDPSSGGVITIERGSGSVTIEYRDVPEFFFLELNTFRTTLYSDGRITFDYGGIFSPDGMTAVSPGGGAADPGQTDVSAVLTFPAAGVTYELFTFAGNETDLTGLTLNFVP